ncbi:15812_t:CDS:2, partial [Racocetra persica]
RQQAKRKLQQLTSITSSTDSIILENLQEIVNYYYHHCNFKDQQNYFYKQSIELETGNNFFEKTQVSVLRFAVHYCESDQSLYTQYFDYFSDVLSHDSC